MRRRRTLGAWRCVPILGVIVAAGPAAAIDLEKLVMPGPVIEGHAKYEGDCAQCHPRLRDTTQPALCLECHEAVADDVRAKSGFHGLAPGVQDTACRSCHAEHMGRDADIVNLDPASFDHGFTDYPLRGAHGGVACNECHEPGSPRRETPADCFSCHEEDDAHAGELGNACGDCHTETAWREAAFDHATTRFPLVGEHADAACGLCHAGQRFENTAMDCNACHAVDDAHRGRFGRDCETCHTPEGWRTTKFDHAAETGFGLLGSHAPLACESCHTQGLEAKLPTDCVACHEPDDVHRGRNGPSCEQCHGETRWADESFDHDRMTQFPLKGGHADVKCERCHTQPLTDAAPTRSCGDCHALDDPHAGQLGADCGRCHNEASWSQEIFFEHDVTAFPLLGMHAVASCEQCHATAQFKDTDTACWACHATDDKHLLRLGTDCGLCHNPNGWQRWRFDHATRTSFALEGAHAELDCHSCHRLPSDDGVSASSACASCHARDDRHSGAFGDDCGRCHGSVSWRDVDVEKLR